MAPLFASPDIAALVAVFPPHGPSKDRPSLVPSRSGNNLVNFEKVQIKLRNLLESKRNRISLTDLSAFLNIKSTSWLLQPNDGALRYSRDGQCIISVPELELIYGDLISQAQHIFVELADFAGKHDISIQSLDAVISELDRGESLRQFKQDNQRFISGHNLAMETKDTISSFIIAASIDKVNLTRHLPDIPTVILRALAQDIVQDAEGELAFENGYLVFLPSEYDVNQKQKHYAARQKKVTNFVYQLQTRGFCHVQHTDEISAINNAHFQNTTSQEVCFQYKNQYPDSMVIILHIVEDQSESVAIVLEHVLKESLAQLQVNAAKLATTTGQNGQHYQELPIDCESILSSGFSAPTLARFLLQANEYRTSIEAAFTAARIRLEGNENLRFAELFRDNILVPLNLYAAGIARVQDHTLKQHLEEYLCEHFNREILPKVTDIMRENGLVRNKTRSRDIDKMLRACELRASLSEIQNVISRFVRKQSIDSPSLKSLQTVKQQTLHDKIEIMRKFTRGSDVLQNTIWILLACTGEGLFISSGKDTSRMIKFYQSIGNVEISTKLEQWRDILKEGKERREDLQEMRDTGMRAVEEMDGDEAAVRDRAFQET